MKHIRLISVWILIFTFSIFAVSCSTKKQASTPREIDGYIVTNQKIHGQSSWYGPGFHGRRTANGERYNMHGKTAAHKTLPFGTVLQVINKTNNKKVIVTVNDRGPFIHGRVLDLSLGAAKELELDRAGVAHVEARVL